MTMQGKFRSRNNLMAAVMVAAFLFLPRMVIREIPITIEIVMWFGFFCLIGLIWFMNMPNSYIADENGVTMIKGAFRRYIAYDDIRTVDVQMLPHTHISRYRTEYRIEYVLTICTAHGVYRYRENCGKVFGEHLNDPNTSYLIDGSELKRLADFINARI